MLSVAIVTILCHVICVCSHSSLVLHLKKRITLKKEKKKTKRKRFFRKSPQCIKWQCNYMAQPRQEPASLQRTLWSSQLPWVVLLNLSYLWSNLDSSRGWLKLLSVTIFFFLSIWPFGFIDRIAEDFWQETGWEGRSDMEQRDPGQESNPDQLQWGQSLYTWDGCSTHWAKQHPVPIFFCDSC